MARCSSRMAREYLPAFRGRNMSNVSCLAKDQEMTKDGQFCHKARIHIRNSIIYSEEMVSDARTNT